MILLAIFEWVCSIEHSCDNKAHPSLRQQVTTSASYLFFSPLLMFIKSNYASCYKLCYYNCALVIKMMLPLGSHPKVEPCFSSCKNYDFYFILMMIYQSWYRDFFCHNLSYGLQLDNSTLKPSYICLFISSHFNCHMRKLNVFCPHK